MKSDRIEEAVVLFISFLSVYFSDVTLFAQLASRMLYEPRFLASVSELVESSTLPAETESYRPIVGDRARNGISCTKGEHDR